MAEQEVVALMESATSAQDWNSKCVQVKEACNGYPAYWYRAIVVSGLVSRVSARFDTHN